MKTARRTYFSILFPVLILFLSVESFGFFPDSTFLPFADSLFKIDSDTQLTARRTSKGKPPYFMVTTTKTINQPYSTVIAKLKNIDMYPDYFTFLLKADKIANKATPTDTVRMFVGGYGLYRVYFFGKIHEEQRPDGSWRIYCGNVEQKLYRKAWRKKVRALIKIGSHDVDIFWTVQKRSDNTTRISLTASQAFTASIASWMVSIGTNRIFRGMVTDFEKYMNKISAEQNAAPETQSP